MAEMEEQGALAFARRGFPLAGSVERFAARRFDRVLEGIRHGQLSLTWPDGQVSVYGKRTDDPELSVAVRLHDLQPIRELALRGEIGFAESFLKGQWSTDSLTRLFEMILRNERELAPTTAGIWLARLLNALNHRRNVNSRRGSRRNIAYHYDLGNAFYKLWLDAGMNYSSALYEHSSQGLDVAQQKKISRVIELLKPRRGARVLEIGCGWGAVSHALARRAQCRVTGISLSNQQLDYARKHHHCPPCHGAGDQGSTCFRYQDYRDVAGKFDHVVSIEMFEAVGLRYWNTYFSQLSERLERGGTAVLQVITIVDERFDAYRRQPDFIQRYIFPGGMLPTKARLRHLVQESGLRLVHSEWFGESYACTLAAWRERFERSAKHVMSLGFDERFLRMWRYYLAYCESGFRLGTTDVGLLLIDNPVPVSPRTVELADHAGSSGHCQDVNRRTSARLGYE